MASRTKTMSTIVVLGIGAAAAVGAVAIYIGVSYFSRKESDDEGKRKNGSSKPGDAPMDPTEDPTSTLVSEIGEGSPGEINLRSVGGNDTEAKTAPSDADQATKKGLTLADIVVSEPSGQDTFYSAEMSFEEISARSLATATPSKSSLPRTATKSYSVSGISTDMFVQIFSDRIVLGASQLEGKFGNYIMCQAIPDEVNPKHVEYEVTSLLGAREDTMLAVYARQITERIEKLQPNPTSMTVIIAISLNKKKAAEPEVFKSIVDLLVDLYRYSAGR